MTPEKQTWERLSTLAANIRRTAKNPGDADSIHDLRVSIRRFTQALRVFDGMFSHTRRMRRRLRELMDLCGSVRNCDIAPKVFAAAGTPADTALEKVLKQRRAHEDQKLAKLLKEWDSHSGMRHWPAWLKAKVKAEPKANDAMPAVPPKLMREFKRLGAIAAKPGASSGQMHKFRLSVKRLRYTLEILSPDSEQLEMLRGLQDRLGAINDCVTTADLLDDFGLGAAAKRRIKAALNRLLANRAAEFRADWATFKQYEKKRRIA
jgi:CHAD domain-containing protein